MDHAICQCDKQAHENSRHTGKNAAKGTDYY